LSPRSVITGIGCVSPARIGGKDAAMALSKDRPGDPGFRVPEFSLEDSLENARPFRRVANATKFALAAVAMALRDAGLTAGREDRSRTGVVVGVTHGAIDFSSRFHGGLLQDGPEAASPMFFAESVLNAPAGNVAMAFGIRGPVHTLIGEETVGAQALETALALLRSDVVDRCVVVGTEERSPLVDNAYEQMDRVASSATPGEAAPPPPGEGAAAIVVERAGEAIRRGATLRVPVLSVRCCRGFRGGMEDSAARVAGEQLSSAGVGDGETAHIVLPTGRNREAVARGALLALGRGGDRVFRLDIAPVVGNPFGAAVLLQASVSAALLSSGDPSGAGLVLSSGIGRTFSVILLGGSPDGAKALPR